MIGVSSALSPLLLRSLQKIVCCDERRKGPTGDLRPRKDGQANCIQLSYWRWRIASRVSANDGLAMSVGEGVVNSTMCKERLGSPRMGRRRFLRQVAAAGLVAGASTSSGASARND